MPWFRALLSRTAHLRRLLLGPHFGKSVMMPIESILTCIRLLISSVEGSRMEAGGRPVSLVLMCVEFVVKLKLHPFTAPSNP